MHVLAVLAAVFLCKSRFAEGGSQDVKGRQLAHLLTEVPEQPGVEESHQPTSVQSPLFSEEDYLADAAIQRAGRLRSTSQQHQHRHAVNANSGWAMVKRQPEQGARAWLTSIYNKGSKRGTQSQLMTSKCRQFSDSSCRSGGDDCGSIRNRKKCTPDGCLWCANNYSPWAGSDGACVSTEQAKYLPDITYTCERVAAVQHLSTAAITLTT